MKKDKTPFDENYRAHGYWERYWTNGELWYKGYYVHGNRYGYWEEYKPNETLELNCNFFNNLKHGYCYYYHENGNLMFCGYFKDGKRYGLFKHYNPTCILVKEIYYYMDKKIHQTSKNKLLL